MIYWREGPAITATAGYCTGGVGGGGGGQSGSLDHTPQFLSQTAMPIPVLKCARLTLARRSLACVVENHLALAIV